MGILDDFRESVRELREDIHDFFWGGREDGDDVSIVSEKDDDNVSVVGLNV